MVLPGRFDVSDQGSASYTVPVSVVPGTAGLQPKLDLVYDSRGGNGLLGVGWSLAGLPAITRCGRTIAQDGVTGGVAFDANDRFCLDGQRLVAVSGTYGADGTEYRTERESFSKVISYGSAGSGPAWFKVWTKAGLVLEFGNTSDSRIEAQGKSSARVWALNKTSDSKGNYFTASYTEDGTNGEYRPDRIDYTGNATAGLSPYASVRFTYEDRTDIELAYLSGSQVKQTKRLAKVQAYQASNLVTEYRLTYDYLAINQRSVVNGIEYCAMSSSVICLPKTLFSRPVASGSIFSSNNNLNSANGTFVDYKFLMGDFNGDGRTDILWYTISNATGLASTGCGACVNANIWLNNGNGTFANSTVPNVNGSQPYIADFNGDGRSDILWNTQNAYGASTGTRVLMTSNGDGTFVVDNNLNSANGTLADYKFLMGDFNRDGKTDILWYTISNATGLASTGCGACVNANIWLNNGNGTFANSTVPNVNGSQPYIADFNGDGRSDILWNTQNAYGASTGTRVLMTSNGDGTFAVDNNLNSANTTFVDYKFLMGDFNGDGRTDILWYTISNATGLASTGCGACVNANIWLNNGNGTFANSTVANVNGAQPYIIDFNGDGYADIVWNTQNGYGASTGTRVLMISKGDGTFVIDNNLNSANGTFVDYKFLMGDFNDDGRTDILWYTISNATGLASTGCGACVNANIWLNNGNGTFANSTVPNVNGSQPYIADFNGDGRSDILWNTQNAYGASTGTRVLLSSDAIHSTLIDLVTSGTGATTKIVYAWMTAGDSQYSRENNALYPILDLQVALPLVSEVRASNGIGGEYRSTYRYVGAKAHAQGRGFLGFRQMIVRDEQSGIEQISAYLQTYPYTGMLASREKKRSATAGAVGPQLNLTTNSYADDTLTIANGGGQRRFVKLTQSVEQSWELPASGTANGTALPSVTTSYQYDAYGNATQVGVSTGDGHSKTTTNTYSNDATNWFLGRLTRAVVQSITP